MDDKLKRFLPDMKATPNQTITMQAGHYMAFIEHVDKSLAQMRTDMNEVFNAVATHIDNLQGTQMQPPAPEKIPTRVQVAIEVLKAEWTLGKTATIAANVIAGYLENGSASAANEEPPGRTAADDDATRQGHVQTEIQSDELGVEGEISSAETGNTRAPE